MGKKVKEKGKLDRSASVSIGGTLYNVHPNVKNTMDGLYREYMDMANVLKHMVPFEEQERNLLNSIVTTCEPLENLPPEMVKFIQDIKDLMKAMQPKTPEVTVEPPPSADAGSTETPRT